MQNGEYVDQRPAEAERLFTSQAIEAEIERICSMLTNKRLAWMFSNCFPNTLDTTVHYRQKDGKEDTFVYTGDVHAMWLRDSGAPLTESLQMDIMCVVPLLISTFRSLRMPVWQQHSFVPSVQCRSMTSR
ncbi:MAG: glycoside hydrolase family 125 protein [Alistipes sp.]|nr:glycoside hydrolase family 125 protein [Alistipes sp.]